MCSEHHNMVNIPSSPTPRNETLNELTNTAANNTSIKLNSTSNDKLEQRYKEILKENDGKLFEVH